jgi:hypothetical protein
VFPFTHQEVRNLLKLVGKQKTMRDFAGTPGTLTGLALRLSQCVFAAGSITAMTTTTSFFDFTAFWYYIIICSFPIQIVLSVTLFFSCYLISFHYV